MMQATLIYNLNAGNTASIPIEDIQRWLVEAGYQPKSFITSDENELDGVLDADDGLVVAAGGDGTVRAVARRLLHRRRPLAILPVGTANNIANSLHIPSNPALAVSGLKNPHPFYYDVGHINLPCGSEYFFEVFGYGLFADGLAAYEPEKGRSLLRSISAAIQALSGYQPGLCHMSIDGVDVSNRYMMVEVMNTSIFGPWIKAAPNADPGDGQFDIVCVREENRDSFLAYLTALINEQFESLPSVEILHGRTIDLEWTGFHFHADAETYPKPDGWPKPEGQDVSPLINFHIELMPGDVEVWLPEDTPPLHNGS